MHALSLEVGVVVIVAGEPATILQCLPKSMVKVLKFKDKTELIIPVDQITPIPETDTDGKEVYSRDLAIIQDRASEVEIKIAEERFIVMGKYIKRELTLEVAIEILGVKKSRFFAMKKLYDENLGVLSLLRQQRGRKLGEKRFTEALEGFITEAALRKRPGKKLTYHKAWEEVRNRCLENGLQAPSIGAVTARIKNTSARQLHALRFGAEAADQLYGARPGHRHTQYPLELVQIDHTLVDIILCDQETREPIGRPWLTVLIDTNTRVILGYYIGFHAPSAVSVACAITHAAFPKQEYLKNIGVDSELYPFYGVPKILHMDNAKEFRSPKLERACVLHAIEVEFRPPGKKHYGGHVERLIGTLMTSHVHFLSGTTFSNTQQRKGYDSEKKSILSLREFIKWFAGQVAIYHASYHRGLDSTPGDAWLKGLTGTDKIITQPPILRDPFRFRLDFMPEDFRAISPKGIQFNGKYYWSPGLIHYVGTKRALIKYDPLSLSRIWVRLNGDYLVANFSDLTNPDMSYEEYLLGKKRNRELKWISSDKVLGVYDSNDKLVKESAKETKKARRKKHAEEEYEKHLRDAGIVRLDNSSSEGGTETDSVVNYSIRPAPLSSEDV